MLFKINLAILIIATCAIINANADDFYLQSSAFADGHGMSLQYAHRSIQGASNTSVPLNWGNIPPDTKSLVLVMYDTHQMANNWIHWFVADIPISAATLPKGASLTEAIPNGALELENSYHELGYGGPAPPLGTGTHPYVFRLYALNVAKLGVTPETRYNYSEIITLLTDKIIASVEITGLYSRDEMNILLKSWSQIKSTD
jgi:Raf kinase inhibitor-like YbhB/YbcL family protein